MNDFLPSYLDTIDERLLGYLDENDELRADTVQRLRFYTSALLDGSLSPAAVAEDWLDWFCLARRSSSIGPVQWSEASHPHGAWPKQGRSQSDSQARRSYRRIRTR